MSKPITDDDGNKIASGLMCDGFECYAEVRKGDPEMKFWTKLEPGYAGRKADHFCPICTPSNLAPGHGWSRERGVYLLHTEQEPPHD